MRGAIEAYFAFPFAYGLGATARYALGWDSYNLGFENRVPGSGLSLGISIDHSRAVTITREATLRALDLR